MLMNNKNLLLCLMLFGVSVNAVDNKHEKKGYLDSFVNVVKEEVDVFGTCFISGFVAYSASSEFDSSEISTLSLRVCYLDLITFSVASCLIKDKEYLDKCNHNLFVSNLGFFSGVAVSFFLKKYYSRNRCRW